MQNEWLKYLIKIILIKKTLLKLIFEYKDQQKVEKK
jgi:hypothetical protein